MKRYFCIAGAAFAALVLSSSAIAQNGFSGYFLVDSFTHSETVPIRSALNDWEGDKFQRGKRQWSHNWFEAGIRYKFFSLGYLARVDYNLSFSEDLAEIYWRTTNKKSFDSNRTYDALLEVNSFKARGNRVAFHFEHKSLQIDMGASFLEAYEFYDGKISGEAETVSSSDYGFNLDLGYYYTEDRLFERQIEKPDGQGYSFDLAMRLDLGAHNLSVEFKDISAYLLWDDAPFTTGKANSNNTTTDSDGFLVVNPTLTGFEGTDAEYRQELKTKSFYQYTYNLNRRYGFGLANKRQNGYSVSGASISYTNQSTWQLGYWPKLDLIQASWQRNRFKVSLGLDSPTKNHVETFWLSLSFL